MITSRPVCSADGSWEIIFTCVQKKLHDKNGSFGSQGSVEAVTELNSFMKTRQPDYNYTFTNKADLIEEIIYQKRVEFWGEGLEYIDNRRFEYSCRSYR